MIGVLALRVMEQQGWIEGAPNLSPLMALAFAGERLVIAVIVASLALLAALGAIGAQTGGASVWRGAVRVTFWGALAMGFGSGLATLAACLAIGLILIPVARRGRMPFAAIGFVAELSGCGAQLADDQPGPFMRMGGRP